MDRPIIVGIDGSSDALAAARYAAELAARHGAPLKVIYVFDTLLHGYGPLLAAGAYAVADEQLRQACQSSLTESVDELQSSFPDLRIEGELIDGSPASVLIARSKDAATTVVGSRGMGGFAELLLGSVSTQVAAHGHGTIVVVRPSQTPDGPVLTGFDGSDASYAALSVAVQEALARDTRLVIAHVYWEKPWGFGPTPTQDPAQEAEKHAEEIITDAVELPLEDHPELRTEIKPIHGLSPERELVSASAGARLVVVGSRGRGGFAGLLLGSVSQALIHHAGCPVAVVHLDH